MIASLAATQSFKNLAAVDMARLEHRNWNLLQLPRSKLRQNTINPIKTTLARPCFIVTARFLLVLIASTLAAVSAPGDLTPPTPACPGFISLLLINEMPFPGRTGMGQRGG